MNTYKTSDNERVSKSTIDHRIRIAKRAKLDNQKDIHGYNFCEDCKKNDCWPIDVSHDISVDECQKSRQTELAWDLSNLTIRGRKCHQKYDGLDLKFNYPKL